MPAPDAPPSTGEHLSIGEVLSLLREEFPDITISKIRFLESQGLIVPERTPSGYRKFFGPDIETLQWVLRQQRDHFLPLKVIKTKLDARRGAPAPPDLSGTDDQPSLFGGEAPPAPDAAERPASAVTEQRGSDHEPDPANEGVVADVIAAALAPTKPASSRGAERPPVGSGAASGGGTAASKRRAPDESTGSATSAGDAAGAEVPESERDPAAWLAALQESPRPDLAPPPAAAPTARPEPRISALAAPLSDTTYSAQQLADEAGVEVEVVHQLAEFGLLQGARFGGEAIYDESGLTVTKAAASILGRGVEARHLRGYKLAAEREVALFEQLILPLLRQRNPDARQQAQESLDELCSMGQHLREALIAQALRSHLRPH